MIEYLETPKAQKYDLVARALHWIMAILFVWQFTSAGLHRFAEDTPIEGFFWKWHHSVGFTLWVLVFLRGAWALVNLKSRPDHSGLWLGGRAVTIGHLLMYALMIAVPTLAILRSAGNGRGLVVYGVTLIEKGRPKIPALVELGSALHGLLGWTLLALIVGHVAIALYHGVVRRDGVLRRMV